MKIQFKLIAVLLLLTNVTWAQRETIFNKVYQTNQLTSFELDIKNSNVAFKHSDDGKIYIDYTIEFDNYSKKEIQKILDDIVINDSIKKDHIKITNTSKNERYFTKKFKFTISDSLVFNYDYNSGKKEDIIFYRKSKDSIIKEINQKNHPLKPLAYDGERFKVKEKNGEIRNARKGKRNKITRTNFIIKIPEHVSITINSKNSTIQINDNLKNECYFDIKKGTISVQNLSNNYNLIKINEADFRIEEITGGDYTFNSVKKGLIGSLKDVNISSEFSKIEIGEIQEGVYMYDFSSNYWFHDFTEDFKEFTLDAGYTKVNLFYPKSSFDLYTYGSNTAHYYNSKELDARWTENNIDKYSSSTMLEIIDFGFADNKILINIENGIIRLGNNQIKIKQ